MGKRQTKVPRNARHELESQAGGRFPTKHEDGVHLAAILVVVRFIVLRGLHLGQVCWWKGTGIPGGCFQIDVKTSIEIVLKGCVSITLKEGKLEKNVAHPSQARIFRVAIEVEFIRSHGEQHWLLCGIEIDGSSVPLSTFSAKSRHHVTAVFYRTCVLELNANVFVVGWLRVAGTDAWTECEIWRPVGIVGCYEKGSMPYFSHSCRYRLPT